MANFRSLVPFGYESLAFPIHCHQVFFSDDEDEPGWKVVLRIEVRGHRVDCEVDEEGEPQLFAMGRNVNFEGLQVQTEVSEAYPNPLPRGRTIELNEILSEVVNDNNPMFDRDIGEPTEDEE